MTYESEAMMEKLLIKDLGRYGYAYIRLNDESAIVKNFREIISKFNKDELNGKPLSDTEFDRLVTEISGQTVFKSAKILRDKFALTRDDDSKAYISFFDSRNYSNNIFQVTNQVELTGKYRNRYDVTVLINGLPIIQIELKRRGNELSEAFNQIVRYGRHSYHGLYRFIQIFIISNGVNTKYFANNDAEPQYSQTFHWTDEHNNRISSVQEFVRMFLDKQWIVKMLSDYTVINDSEKKMMVMRPYQVFATEAIARRAESNKSGYVWHTTGSGKTLTSFKAAQIMSRNPRIKKVIFLVDRTDLDVQTFDEFNKFEEGSVDRTDNTATLVRQMADQNNRLIVTTIQKMTNAVKNAQYSKTMDLYKDEKVVFIIDECHRSQFGTMHMILKRQFEKALYFGFTGTPRFEKNKGPNDRTTADIFSDCLHTYLITQAIADKNVLGFMIHYYNTIIGKFNDQDPLKVEDIDREEALMNDERIQKIVTNIIKDHSIYTKERRYTAILTVSSIPMLVKYYDEFARHEHNLKVAAVFTWDDNEDLSERTEHSRDSMERIIANYNRMFGTNFNTDISNSYQRDISKKVKSKEIDILIVVNMFLTGFDSKTLNTLYVDRFLEHHTLLQAYSRTNRVENNEWKRFGTVVCYINLKKKTDEALRLFSNDSNVNKILAKEYGEYRIETRDAIRNLRIFVPTPDDVDKLMSEEDQKRFILLFKDVARGVTMMESFVEFDFMTESGILNLDEVTYGNYKSKYLDIYASRPKKDKISVLNDVDFVIELMETDRINYDYIRMLIRNIDAQPEEARKRCIEKILEELEHTDNLELRRKVDLLKLFLSRVSAGTVDLFDLDGAYVKFEEAQRALEIEEFAKDIGVDSNLLRKEIAEYEYTGMISNERLYENLAGGFLEKKKKKGLIMEFIISNTEKYQ